jgi:hypothetical protein
MADFESARAGNLKPGPVSHGDRMCKGCGKTFGTYRSYNAHHSRRDAPLACRGRHNEQSVTATVNSRNYRVLVQGGGCGGPGPRDGGPGDDRDRASLPSQQPRPGRVAEEAREMAGLVALEMAGHLHRMQTGMMAIQV